MEFLLPTERHRADVADFYAEIRAAGSECIGLGAYTTYDRWLQAMQARHAGTGLPEGYVRENFYLCYDGGQLIGVFSLKFELTEYLLHYGGHVGYAVRPSARNRGLATRMLQHGCALARQLGFSRLLCVCDETNLASEKVIVKNGGELKDTQYDPEEGVAVRRYWIQL